VISKKYLSILFSILVIGALALAACGPAPTPTAPVEEPTEAPATGAPATEPPAAEALIWSPADLAYYVSALRRVLHRTRKDRSTPGETSSH